MTNSFVRLLGGPVGEDGGSVYTVCTLYSEKAMFTSHRPGKPLLCSQEEKEKPSKTAVPMLE